MTTNEVLVLDGELLHEGASSGSPLMRPVEFVAAILLVVMIGLLLLGVTSRYALHLPIVWIDEGGIFLLPVVCHAGFGDCD